VVGSTSEMGVRWSSSLYLLLACGQSSASGAKPLPVWQNQLSANGALSDLQAAPLCSQFTGGQILMCNRAGVYIDTERWSAGVADLRSSVCVLPGCGYWTPCSASPADRPFPVLRLHARVWTLVYRCVLVASRTSAWNRMPIRSRGDRAMALPGIPVRGARQHLRRQWSESRQDDSRSLR